MPSALISCLPLANSSYAMNTIGTHQDHLSTCEYRDEQCTQCGQYIQHLNMSAHQREQCPMRPTTCPHCNEDVPIQQLQVCVFAITLVYYRFAE